MHGFLLLIVGVFRPLHVGLCHSVVIGLQKRLLVFLVDGMQALGIPSEVVSSPLVHGGRT